MPQRYFRLGNRLGITFYLFCPEEAPFCLGNPAGAGKEIRASNQENRRHPGGDGYLAGSFPGESPGTLAQQAPRACIEQLPGVQPEASLESLLGRQLFNFSGTDLDGAGIFWRNNRTTHDIVAGTACIP